MSTAPKGAKALKKAVRVVLAGLAAAFHAALAVLAPFFMVYVGDTAEAVQAERVNRFERDCALALLAGEALSGYDRYDERLILRLLIENLEQPFEAVAVGSSRVLQVSADAAGAGSFYNCGLSGADYRDIMNVYYMLEKAGKLPKTLIIGLDPWIFNGDVEHHLSDADLFSEFISLRLGYDTGRQPTPEARKPDFWERAGAKRFRGGLGFMLSDSWQPTPVPVAQGDLYMQGSQLKLPDGTALYPSFFREASADTAEERARVEAATFMFDDNFTRLSPERLELFARFVRYVRANGVRVVLLLAPYHPTVYNYALENRENFSGFFRCEQWAATFAAQDGIPMYGSYSPFVTGSRRQDFYDGYHIKGSAIARFFPGAGESAVSSNPSSPWLRGRVRVPYVTAEYMVRERYEIAPPHILRRGDDIEINGGVCHQLLRYGASDGQLLLARYAVDTDEGIIYRFDTDLMEWVVDLRFPEI